MSSVESVLDELVRVKTIDYPVSVFLDRSGEDYQFEVLAHLFEESLYVRSEQELSALRVLFVVDEGFVEIEDCG